MNRFAIEHIPMSQYAHGVDEKHIVLRLRAARGDLKSCTLFYADRACRLTPVIFSVRPMELAARDELFDYFEAELAGAYKRLCYYFALDDGAEQTLYYGDLFTDHLVDDRSEYYQFPYNRREDIAAPPAWAKDAIIYNIFPDSFASSRRSITQLPIERDRNGVVTHGKLGGTLRGITDNVDYLKKLGVNAIYINPIFAAGEYHKYDLLDYYHIDPCFGNDEEFRELVRVYHDNGLRVIIDGVFNHCGWRFFAFEDVVQKGARSRYTDWFYRLSFPVVRPDDPETYPNYECFGYERLMPKLNTGNPEVVDYFCDVGRHWLREYGIDGWRLDVASEVDDGFWRAFRRAAKEENPEAILIGEVWESAGHWLDGSMFDSTMNYDFRKHCRRFFAEGAIDAYEFDARVTHMRMRYRRNMLYAQLNLLDSHDASRFFSLCGEDAAKLELAVLFQLTFPGMPSIFYGDEQGLSGLREEDYRRPMTWGEGGELYGFYRTAIDLRKSEPALREGSFRTLAAERGSGLYAFERGCEGGAILVAFNPGARAEALPPEFQGKKTLWARGVGENILSPMGFVVAK